MGRLGPIPALGGVTVPDLIGVFALSVMAAMAPWGTYFHFPSTSVLVPVILVGALVPALMLKMVYNGINSRIPWYALILAFYVSWVFLSRGWTTQPEGWMTYLIWLVICAVSFIGAATFLGNGGLLGCSSTHAW